jgi:NADP-dependent aldehyde dehydrogenase
MDDVDEERVLMIQGFSPRTGKPTGEPVAETTGAEVDAAVDAAAEALPAWAALDDEDRARALEAIADALDERAADLVALADEETALGETRLTGEVGRTTGQLRLFAGVVRDGGYADIAESPAAGGIPEIRRVSHPVGPVAVFAASNFPFAFSVMGGDTASALAAGCPVVVKAHEGHPGTSDLTAQLARQALASAGAPRGVFALIHGVDAGLRLLNHPAITAAGFTGSTGGGLALAKVCAGREVPIPFYGELGAVNPVVVLPGAAAQRAADIAAGYAGSLTLGAGQFCTNPGLLFVPESDQALRTAIAAAVGESRGGPMLSERIYTGYEAALAEIEAHPAVDAVAAGTTGEGPWGATPRLFTTTLEQFAADIPVLAKERFGPAGLVITYPSATELLPVLAQLGGNLVGSVHGDPDDRADLGTARQVIAVFERTVGRIVWNGWPTGVAVNAAQHHGGPYPATTAPAFTSVGSAAIRRWLIPVAYQGLPAGLLPARLAGQPAGTAG